MGKLFVKSTLTKVFALYLSKFGANQGISSLLILVLFAQTWNKQIIYVVNFTLLLLVLEWWHTDPTYFTCQVGGLFFD
jgi:hypothetical protein